MAGNYNVTVQVVNLRDSVSNHDGRVHTMLKWITPLALNPVPW
jgi:hypothetical protein